MLVYPLSFSTLLLLLGRQEGNLTCKTSATTILQNLLLEISLTWSNLAWSNSRKMSLLNKQTLYKLTFYLLTSNTFCSRYLTGQVDKRTLEKYEREAKEKNRESW